MHWNYRVMRHKDPTCTWFGFHEVYYNDEGKVESYSQSQEPYAEDLDGLKWVIDRMKEALYKPVLEYEGL